MSAQKREESTLFVVTEGQSTWMSCRTITANLLKAYQQVQPKAPILEHPKSPDPVSVLNLAEKIWSLRPKKVVFLDHFPHPGQALRALHRIYQDSVLPDLFVHIYGCFTLYPREWLESESVLKGQRLKFICASTRQESLIRQFLIPTDGGTGVCPFPVDNKIFHFDPKRRDAWRQEHGFKTKTPLIAYSGRLSLQKNSIELLKTMEEVLAQTPEAQFVIAGTADDIGAPFFGVQFPRGYFPSEWNRALQKAQSKFPGRIHYLGHLPTEKLASFYNGTDIQVSLSLHHDEDFGMAPAEGLCCGQAAVLTSWGGYAGFEGLNGDCRLIPVYQTSEGYGLERAKAVQMIFEQIQGINEVVSKRSARANRYQSRFSVQAVSGRLQEQLGQRPGVFRGFNRTLHQYAQFYKTGSPYYGDRERGEFYGKVYEHYIKD